MAHLQTAVLLLLAVVSLSPWGSPGLGLLLGIAFALTIGNPHPKTCSKLSKPLLQICVVALGLGMDLSLLLRAGRDGFLLGALTIVLTLSLGHWAGRRLGINPNASALISAGTAICGGSAIAAVGAVIGAAEAEMAVAMGTTFLLNAVALYLFPAIGHALHLSQDAFGTWSGIAIHDVSSVVGAASAYGPEALDVATAVKLSRALWIVPVALAFASFWPKPKGEEDVARPKVRVPWFILGFVLASLARTVSPAVVAIAPLITPWAHAGMSLTLFLIGAGISRPTLKSVGSRPLAQGLLLWITISGIALLAVTL